MTKMEEAVRNFCEALPQELGIEAVFQGGSSIYDQVEADCDVDLFVVTDDNERERMSGICRINGFTIEYFVNPIGRIIRQFDEELNNYHDYWAIKIYAFSNILYDSRGNGIKLKKLALNAFERPFSPNEKSVELGNYYDVFDSFTEYCSHIRLGINSEPMYYETLKRTLHAYCYQHGLPLIPWSKSERLLSDPEFRKNYHLKNIPDAAFCKKFLVCLKQMSTNEKDSAIRDLYAFVMSQTEFSPEYYCRKK